MQWRSDFQSGSRVLNLFLCISSLECSDAEQYWISLGNERQSAPQYHLHIIFLTMIRLVEWSWCWFVCQEDFSIQNKFAVKKEGDWKAHFVDLRCKERARCLLSSTYRWFPNKTMLRTLYGSFGKKEICCVSELIPEKTPFWQSCPNCVRHGGGRVICTIPKRKVDFSRISVQKIPIERHRRKLSASEVASNLLLATLN